MELLTQLREAQDQLAEHDAQVIGVGPTADYQAQSLLDEGMPFPLLLDPDNALRHAVGAADRFTWRQLMNPGAVRAYWQAKRQAKNSDPIWSQTTERPVVLVLDQHLNITWTHIGEKLGDYPSIDQVLAALDRTG